MTIVLAPQSLGHPGQIWDTEPAKWGDSDDFSSDYRWSIHLIYKEKLAHPTEFESVTSAFGGRKLTVIIHMILFILSLLDRPIWGTVGTKSDGYYRQAGLQDDQERVHLQGQGQDEGDQ